MNPDKHAPRPSFLLPRTPTNVCLAGSRGRSPQRSPFFPQFPPLSTILPHLPTKFSPVAPAEHPSDERTDRRVGRWLTAARPGPTMSERTEGRAAGSPQRGGRGLRRRATARRTGRRGAVRARRPKPRRRASRPGAGRRRTGGTRPEAASTSARGRRTVCQQAWKRAACRVRRWLDADQLGAVEEHLTRAETVEADRRRPRRSSRADPRCTSTRPARPGAAADQRVAHVRTDPAHRRPHVVERLGRPRGTITSSHTTSPGTSSTAPPPLRRRTTSTPARATGVAVDGRVGAGVEPSTSAGAVTSCHQIVGWAGSGIGRSCNDRAGPAVCSSGEAVQRRAQDASGRYGRQVSGMPLTDTTTQAVARGARHGRASRIPASSGVRSRLVRLHGRQAAATFSHVCGPPFDRGHDVVDRVGALAAVLAPVVVAGEDRPARQRGAADEGHLDHVPQPDHRRARHGQRRRVDHVPVVFDARRPSRRGRDRSPAARTRHSAARNWR